LGSMAKAAVHLNITQPGVSKAISTLERTVGVPLVDRTPRGIVPTMYGDVMLRAAGAVFDDLGQGLNEIEFLNDPTFGQLRFATIQHLTAGFVPKVIVQLSSSHPRVEFYVEELSVQTLQYRELRDRRVEFVMTRIVKPLDEPDMDVEILFDDPLFVAAGINSPWARRRNIKLADVVNEPWTHVPYSAVGGPVIEEAFQSQGLTPPAGVSCTNMQMHKALLATARYLAILPSSLLRFAPEQWSIKRLPIVLTRRPMPVGIISLRNRTMSPTARRFIQCARE